MKFLSNSNYHNEVKRLFSNDLPLDVAVAFFGSKSVSRVTPNNTKPIRVICNLESSACNPYEIRKLQKRPNVTVKTNRHLHAKVLLQEREVIIGSANISANGLSFEDSELVGWIEAGALISDKPVIMESHSWFSDLWQNSIVVTNEILKTTEEHWKKKRNQRMPVKTKGSLLSAAKNNLDNFRDRDVYFVMYGDRLSQEAQTASEGAESVHSSLSGKIGCYENWRRKIPNNSYLIDIYYGPRGGVQIYGIYQTPEEPIMEKFTYENGEPGEVKLCFKRKSIYGYELTREDESVLKKHVEQLWKCDSHEDTSIISFSKGLKIMWKSI